MEMNARARALADDLGLTGTHVFFHEWIDYDERQNFLLEADIGVSTHFDHVETAFSFRTRVLDYLWAGLPTVVTEGDVLAELITEHGRGSRGAAPRTSTRSKPRSTQHARRPDRRVSMRTAGATRSAADLPLVDGARAARRVLRRHPLAAPTSSTRSPPRRSPAAATSCRTSWSRRRTAPVDLAAARGVAGPRHQGGREGTPAPLSWRRGRAPGAGTRIGNPVPVHWRALCASISAPATATCRVGSTSTAIPTSTPTCAWTPSTSCASTGTRSTELYMGHFLEHLLPASATALLAIIADKLPEGAEVSAVVPDMRAVFAAYDRGELTNEFLNERFIYSYEQPSHHVWCYDVGSLRRVFEAAGYDDVEEIDPRTWDPVFWKEGPESRWQCGLRATVPAAGTAPKLPMPPRDDGSPAPREHQPVLADELLLQRIQQLRARVEELESSGVGPAIPPPSLFDRLPGPLAPAAKRLLPEGSRQRKAARFGIDAVPRHARARRSPPRRARSHRCAPGAQADVLATGTSTRRRRAKTLAKQRAVSANVVGPVGIECVVVQRGRDPRDEAHAPVDPRADVGSLAGHRDRARRASPPQPTPTTTASAAHHVAARGALAEVNPVLAHEPRRDFVMVVEAGDMLAPDCFFEIAHLARQDPLARPRLLGRRPASTMQGRRTDPQFRPSWSPDMLLGANYIGRSFAMRHRRFARRSAASAPSLGDAALVGPPPARADLDADARRPGARACSAHLTRRPNPSVVQCVNVVEDHLAAQRAPRDGHVRAGYGARSRWEPAPSGRTSPSSSRPATTGRSIDGVPRAASRRTDYPTLDVVVVDNGERTDDNEQWYARHVPRRSTCAVEWWDRARSTTRR